MKSIRFGRIAGAAALFSFFGLISNADAALLVSDPFSYSDGNLVGNDAPIGGTWTAHSGAGSVPVQVSGGTISIAQGSGSREDVNVPFEGGAAAGSGDVFYAAFDLTVADPDAAIVDVNFAHFLRGTSAFSARIWMTAPTASGYRLALSNDNSITDADGEVFTGDLAFDTTYRIVTSYDYDNKNSRLWVNPVNEASASIAATDPGFSDAVASYAFRQAGGNTVQVIDNLNVATSFQEALTGAAIPEPASSILLGLATLGGVAVRRRKR